MLTLKPVSFICISDEKMLYNLTKISVCFPSYGFPLLFLVTLPLLARGFFMRGKGM